VIDKGELVESGKHQELLANQGRYARMWQAQQSIKEWHITSAQGVI